MSEAARNAWRLGIGAVIGYLSYVFFRYDLSVRDMTCMVLLTFIPTFSIVALRDRLMISILTGALSLIVCKCFYQANWFYVPAFTIIGYISFTLASRTGDPGAVALAALGIASFVPTRLHAIEFGIGKIFYDLVGIIGAWIAFVIIPPAARKTKESPQLFVLSQKDIVYLSFAGGVAMLLWGLLFYSSNVLILFGCMIATVKITEEGEIVFAQRIAGAFVGTLLSLIPLITLSSLNSITAYIAVGASLVGGLSYLGFSNKKMKPFIMNLCTFFLVLSVTAPGPQVNLKGFRDNIEELWLGTIAGILIMKLRDILSKIEDSVEAKNKVKTNSVSFC